MIRCILACDLKGGLVVRGIKGDRENYRPIGETSLAVKSSAPLDVIRAMRPKETYVADLDRIMGRGDHFKVVKEMSALTRVMLDAGVSSAADVETAKRSASTVILGTETAPMSLIREYGGRGVVLSLDMKNGMTMAADAALRVPPLQALERLNDVELDAVILLDIGRVGAMGGVDLGLVESAVSASKHDIIVGGGVRSVEDLDAVEKAGASGAVVASSIHDGRIPLSSIQGRE